MAFAILLAAASIVGCSPVPQVPSPAAATAVVGLGDSVPAGSACGCSTFVSLVADALADHGKSLTHNLAVPGQTSEQLLALLSAPSAAALLAGAGVVLVTIGANDFDAGIVASPECADPHQPACYDAELTQLGAHLDAILTSIDELDAGAGTSVFVTGYWNVFLDGTIGRARGAAYVANSDALTRAVNAVLSASAVRHGADYVDLYAAFKGAGAADDTGLLAADGDHPNAAGHQLIARTVLSALRSVRPSTASALPTR